MNSWQRDECFEKKLFFETTADYYSSQQYVHLLDSVIPMAMGCNDILIDIFDVNLTQLITWYQQEKNNDILLDKFHHFIISILYESW